ncbi:MAG: prolyl oligopeptidase family serine peptidase [Sporolactobacillus sp.]
MNRRLIEAEDLYRFTFAGSPVLSPDAQQVIYVVTRVSKEKNGYQSALYLSDSSGKNRRLTFEQSSEKLVRNEHPRFSADGRSLYFLSDRGGQKQVWLLSLDGGEAEKLTDFKEGVKDFDVAADGHALICQSPIPDKEEADNDQVSVVTRLRYLANGKGLISSDQGLFLFDCENKKKRLISSPDCDAYGARFAPDGQSIFFLQGKPHPDKTDYLYDLFRYDLPTRETLCLYQGKGTIDTLEVSADGHSVAFSGTEDGECTPKNIAIYLLPTTGGAAIDLTAAEQLSVGNFIGTDVRFDGDRPSFKWSGDGQSLYYLVQNGRKSGIRKVSLSGMITDVSMAEEEVITSFDIRGSQIAAIISTPLSTGDLYFFNAKRHERKKLSAWNEALFRELDLSKPIPFTYKGAEEWPMDGYLLLPPKTSKNSGPLPVILEIHGGPASSYGDSFNHEFQLLAAQGYAVVYTNPRGSRGYGEAFCAGCYDDWGRKDKEDILKGLDAALARFPQLDRARQFVTGGSYGGFMTNTIVGTTNRFTAAVTQRSICNLYNFFGTSDIGYYFLRRYFCGTDLWSDEEKIMSFSPIRHAPDVRTPVCIIHSEEDHRCPIEQAEQWYTALRRLGVETRFVRIKGENHELSRSGKPKNRIRRLQEIIAWFNRYR